MPGEVALRYVEIKKKLALQPVQATPSVSLSATSSPSHAFTTALVTMAVLLAVMTRDQKIIQVFLLTD